MAEQVGQSWENEVPSAIRPAVSHLRKEFLAGHFKNGEITRQACFEILHSPKLVTSGKWERRPLREVEAVAGAEATATFESFLACDTLSSTVAAFFGLYVQAMKAQATDIFHKLLAIGSKNLQIINSAPLEWAKAQVKELVESREYLIRRWVKDICDEQWTPGQPLPPAGGFHDWKDWAAPRFLVMEPLGTIGLVACQEPFDSHTAHERLDAVNTEFTLRYFEERYAQVIRIAVRRVAGEAAVYMAINDGPPPYPPTSVNKPPRDPEVQSPAAELVAQTALRAQRLPKPKEDTQSTYAAWQKRYKVLKTAHPGMADSAIAAKIATEHIGNGKSANTIRHNMKP